MKPENLLDAMQHISPDLIAEAKPLPKPAELRDTETAETVRIRNEEGSKPMKKITQHIMTGVSIAAAVAVCAGIGVFIAKNGRSGGLNEPSSASVTSDVNTGATATDIAPVTRNFLGGTGELHFDMLHEVVLGSDDEYWYILFDDGVYTIKKSSDTYLPLMNSETQTAYFTEKLGQAPSQFLTDASGNLYVTVHHDHTDEHPVNYTSELEVFRVTKDGQTESMGMLRFNSTDSKQYFGRINYIDIFGENNDTISFMGIASVVSNEGVRLHTCPSFKAEAKLTDGKFGTLEGSSIEFYDEAEAVSNTDRVNYAWKDNYSYYLNKAGDLVRTAPFSSQYPNEELVVAANPPIKDIAQEKGSDEMYSLRTDGTVIYKSDVEWSNPQSIWSKEDPHNRWCRTSDALAEYGLEDVGSQEPRFLAGVFDGKLWGGCNAVCLLIDTKTGICQYAYNPAYLTPDTGSAATAAESGTTAPETTETTASPYSENEEQAIRYAKYAFEEWVNIEAGKGGDMHQYARDKNLAAYLNYAAKDYSNAERLNQSQESGWMLSRLISRPTHRAETHIIS